MLLISSIISGHHKNLLNPNVTQYGCNCRIREDCPLQNQCLTPNIIYRVDVHCEANKDHKFYFGVVQTPFKESSGTTTGISITNNILKAQSYPNTSGR